MDQLTPEDDALLNFVNGKGNSTDILTLILAKYLVLSESALNKLWELRGAVHGWDTHGTSTANN